MKYIHYVSAKELAELIREKKLSPVEAIEETIARIEAVNPLIKAFVTIRADQTRLAKGIDPGPLAGVPIGVKDLEDLEGMVTSFESIPSKDNLDS